MVAMTPWKLIFLFAFSYVIVFTLGGAIVWLIADGNDNFTGITNYGDAVIFVGYTVTTVGFGNQYPNYPASSLFPLVLVVMGLLMDAFWLGIIFARISSPRPLRHTILFSKTSVLHPVPSEAFLEDATEEEVMKEVANDDADRVWECRIVNLRHRYPWVDLSIKITLATFEHASNNIRMQPLEVCNERESSPFFDLPWTVRHRVTHDSPLYQLLESNSFGAKRGEIIVELNGQDPLTGNGMLKRFSYISNEVVKDHIFVNCLATEDNDTKYSANLTLFHDTIEYEKYQSAGYGTATYNTPRQPCFS